MERKSIIGILLHSTKKGDSYEQSLNDFYRKAVVEAGGIPLAILPTQNIIYDDTTPSKLKRMSKEEQYNLINILKLCDGIILPGGNRWYEYDEIVCSYALKNNIPVLGICMGMQLMNTVDSRKVCDKPNLEKNNSNINHKQKGIKYAHDVLIKPNTILYDILGKEKIKVNSSHNFHITKTNNFIVSAESEDGYIEAIELPDHVFALGIQWHPEKMIDYDINAQKILKKFISKTTKFKKL